MRYVHIPTGVEVECARELPGALYRPVEAAPKAAPKKAAPKRRANTKKEG